MAWALSTIARDPTRPVEIAARADRLGLRDVALDAGLDADTLSAVAAALLTAGCQMVAVEAPCPRQHPQGGRPPHLASDDREERLAAKKAFEATVAVASRFGARLVVTQLGVLPVAHHWDRTVRAFARRTLDDDERERFVGLRRKLSAHALDLARYALDGIMGLASDSGITVGLANRARWFEIPSVVEIDTLLADFRGAALAPVYDSAAAHVRAALGLGTGRPAVELEQAAGALLSDAAGLRGGLPWGTGEIDRTAILAKLPAGAPRILRSAIATDEEILAALL